ncbi:hypothetical protein H632_c1760p1, partial [Helicosporidium sp. ATCC 50920]
LEDQQSNKSGWLSAKGAFDKSDLLHAREAAEKVRLAQARLEADEKAEYRRAVTQTLQSKGSEEEGVERSAAGVTSQRLAAERGPVVEHSATRQPIASMKRAGRARIRVKEITQSTAGGGDDKGDDATSDGAKRLKRETVGNCEIRPRAEAAEKQVDSLDNLIPGPGAGLESLLGSYGCDSDSD